MTTHRIKIDTTYVDAVLSGLKPFEVRKNDRARQVVADVTAALPHPRTWSWQSRRAPSGRSGSRRSSHRTTPGTTSS